MQPQHKLPFTALIVILLIYFVMSAFCWMAGDVSAEDILQLPDIVAIGHPLFKLKEERKEVLSPEKVSGIKDIPEEMAGHEDLPSGLEEGKVSPQDTPSSCCMFGSPIEKFFSQTILGEKGYYDLGRFKYQQGQYEEAFKLFHELMTRYPDSTYLGQAYYWAAESAFQARDWNVAAFYYRHITEYLPRSPYADYAFYSLGWLMDQRGEYEEAVNLFKALLFSYYESPVREKAHYLLGNVLYKMGQFRNAAKEYDLFLRNYPLSPLISEAAFWRAEALFQAEKTEEAGTSYAWFLDNFPEHPRARAVMYGLSWVSGLRCRIYHCRTASSLSTSWSGFVQLPHPFSRTSRNGRWRVCLGGPQGQYRP